jgi:hypothetical protein
MKFKLPKELRALVEARNKLVNRYSDSNLKFTFDGNLVGDLGEAVASELFELELVPPATEGVDAKTRCGKTVQIKATGTGRGPAFRYIKNRADYLIFLDLDFEKGEVEVIFNGPESIALSKLPPIWTGQRTMTAKQIRDAASLVEKSDMLKLIGTPISG